MPIVWRDNFECHTPFAIDNIEGWTIIDNDGGATWGWTAVDYLNELSPMSGLIWNNNEATPVDGADISLYNSYEGNQGLYFLCITNCFCSK